MKYTFETDNYETAQRIMGILGAAPVAPAPVAVPVAAPAAPVAAPAAQEPQIDFTKLRDAVYKLAMKDNAKIKAIADKYGVKNFKDLPQDKWQEAYDAILAGLAA